MPYSKAHHLLTIGGALGGGVERWSIGLRFGNDVNVPATQAMVNACVAPISTWFKAGDSAFSNSHRIDQVKLADIGTDGRYPPGLDSFEAAGPLSIAGTNVSVSLPYQCSLVVSLVTALPRGKGHIGRVYLPPFASIANAGTSQILDTSQPQIANNFATMLRALRDTVSGLGDPTVFGKTGTGTAHAITAVRVGKVFDTQRRRRRSLPESYLDVAL